MGNTTRVQGFFPGQGAIQGPAYQDTGAFKGIDPGGKLQVIQAFENMFFGVIASAVLELRSGARGVRRVRTGPGDIPPEDGDRS